MDINEFLRVNNIVMDKIKRTPVENITKWIDNLHTGNGSILRQIDQAKIVVSQSHNIALKEVVVRRAYIGACALMYMHPRFINELVSEAEIINDGLLNEKKIVQATDLKSVEDARSCLRTFFDEMLFFWMNNNLSFSYVPECSRYYKSGLMLPHLGVLIHDSRRIDIGSIARVREFVFNQLVVWFLEVMRNIAYGSTGAGEIGVFGAYIGRGKTTTVFYSLKTALMTIGFSEEKAEEYASKLIILDPDLTLDILDAVVDSDVKVPFLIIDNASSAFPKHWIQLGGSLMKRLIRFNKILANIRALSGITLFIPNGPNEVSSFIRSFATLRIRGYKIDYIKFDGSVFETDKEVLGLNVDENVVKTNIVANIFIYPLIKMPDRMYNLDREIKKVVSKHEIEALKTEKVAEEVEGEPA
jgi:hypothetical protein